MKTMSNHSAAVVLALCLVLAWCFSAEASATQLRAQRRMRGSRQAVEKGEASGKEEADQEDEDDDDEDDDDDEASAPAGVAKKSEAPPVDPHAAEEERLEDAVKAVQRELADNLRKQLALKNRIEHLTDKSASDMEIDTSAKLVANETESVAMASMLGNMWKELRMFEVPFYAQEVGEKRRHLERDEKALEKQLTAAQAKLSAAKKKWAKEKKKQQEEDDKEEEAKRKAQAIKKRKVEAIKNDDEDEDEAPAKKTSKDAKAKEEDDGEDEADPAEKKEKTKAPHEEVADGVKRAESGNPASVQLHSWSVWHMPSAERHRVYFGSLVYLFFGVLLAVIYKQAQNYHPAAFAPKVANDTLPSNKGFSFHLFSCLSDPKICCLGCCCMSLRWSDTVSQKRLLNYWKAFFLFFGSLLLTVYTMGLSPLFVIVLGVVYRQKLRRAYQIQSGTAKTLFLDLLTWCFCQPCAVIQEAREEAVRRGDA